MRLLNTLTSPIPLDMLSKTVDFNLFKGTVVFLRSKPKLSQQKLLRFSIVLVNFAFSTN